VTKQLREDCHAGKKKCNVGMTATDTTKRMKSTTDQEMHLQKYDNFACDARLMFEQHAGAKRNGITAASSTYHWAWPE
jgi:hypothetical protein